LSDFVTPAGWRVDEAALEWSASRSGGPGGQHANTSDTAVTVTLDVAAAGLPTPVRDRVVSALGQTVSARAADTRSQWRNRQLAWQRLSARIDAAAVAPRTRLPTTPTPASRERRLDRKRRRGEVKRSRRRGWDEDG
jgi:ribosome-associated protein